MTKASKTRQCLILCCMCICSLLLVSCFSVPGEKDAENKNLGAAYYDLGVKYSETKQYEKALTCFQNAREKASSEDYAKIDYQIARAYALSNKWDEASAAYEKLLELDSDNQNLKEAYAYVTFKRGQKEKALQLYAELCESDPSNERLSKNYESIMNELYPPEEPQEAIGS